MRSDGGERGWWVALVATLVLAGGVFAATQVALGEGPGDGRPATPPVIDKTPTASTPGKPEAAAPAESAAPAAPEAGAKLDEAGTAAALKAAMGAAGGPGGAVAVVDGNATAAEPPKLVPKGGPTRLWALDLAEREAALAAEREALKKEQEAVKKDQDAMALRVTALEAQGRDLEARKKQVADLATAVGAQWDAQAARLTTPDPNAIVLPANLVEANEQLDLVASIVKKMKPKAAAALMSTWKDPLTVDIIGRLKPRTSSAILNLMDPVISARVTTQLARLGIPTPLLPPPQETP